MALHSFLALSHPPFGHDALTAIGAVVALLAAFAFINVGLLLPGLFTWLDGRHGDANRGFVEFGPGAAPLISEPAPRRAAQAELPPDRQQIMRPHIWRHLTGGVTPRLGPPIDAVKS
jgi:hypothetical protein